MERLRPERGAQPPSESERGWGPASTERRCSGPPVTHGCFPLFSPRFASIVPAVTGAEGPTRLIRRMEDGHQAHARLRRGTPRNAHAARRRPGIPRAHQRNRHRQHPGCAARRHRYGQQRGAHHAAGDDHCRGWHIPLSRASRRRVHAGVRTAGLPESHPREHPRGDQHDPDRRRPVVRGHAAGVGHRVRRIAHRRLLDDRDRHELHEGAADGDSERA